MTTFRRATLLGLLLLALAPAAASAAGPEPGIVASVGSSTLSPTELSRITASGARTARFFMFTSNPATQYDALVAQLTAAGVKPLFVVVGDPTAPPATDAAVQAYVTYLQSAVSRFRGKVAAWEIWNEEDAPKWWAGAPSLEDPTRDASAFTRLLKASYAAEKAIDPATPVVMGGLTGNDYRFLQSVYDNGGGGAFDVVATHTDTACSIASPYSYYRDTPGGPISQWAFLGYRSVHDVMAANGDGAKQIWLTEFGWSTASGTCAEGRWAGQKAAGVSEADQALFTTQAFHCMAQDPYVTKALLFKLADAAGTDADSHFGALHLDLTPKPVFSAFATYAAQGDTLPASEACGDFTGPAVTIATPANAVRFAKDLVIKVAATDVSGVGRITLLVDGKTKIRNFTDKTMPSTLAGAIDWMGAKRLSRGPHTLTVQAVDSAGNVGTKTIAITKVAPGQLGTSIRTKVRVKLGGTGHRRVLHLTVRASSAGVGGVGGKLRVLFQKRRGTAWVTAHKYGHGAAGAWTLPVTLEPARWRVVVTYSGQAPYAGSTAALPPFTV